MFLGTITKATIQGAGLEVVYDTSGGKWEVTVLFLEEVSGFSVAGLEVEENAPSGMSLQSIQHDLENEEFKRVVFIYSKGQRFIILSFNAKKEEFNIILRWWNEITQVPNEKGV